MMMVDDDVIFSWVPCIQRLFLFIILRFFYNTLLMCYVCRLM